MLENKIRHFFLGHSPVLKSETDYVVHEKGDRRNVVVFAGKVYECNCGAEFFDGNLTAWFEGTYSDFQKLLKEKSHGAKQLKNVDHRIVRQDTNLGQRKTA
jgi:hypothetical protein